MIDDIRYLIVFAKIVEAGMTCPQSQIQRSVSNVGLITF